MSGTKNNDWLSYPQQWVMWTYYRQCDAVNMLAVAPRNLVANYGGRSQRQTVEALERRGLLDNNQLTDAGMEWCQVQIGRANVSAWRQYRRSQIKLDTRYLAARHYGHKHLMTPLQMRLCDERKRRR